MLIGACGAAGLWPCAAGSRPEIAPPLIISEKDLVKGLDAIDAALDVADARVVRSLARFMVLDINDPPSAQ